MNQALQALFARRSVRKYKDREIPEAMIKDVLEATMAAPSAVAKDPWEFIVVRDKDMLGRIADGLPNGQMLRDAAVGLVICGDMDKAHDHQESYMLQDCSAAIENTLVAASMLGLGTCWLGVHPRQERVTHLRNLFGFPENVIPVSVIAMGWPAEQKEPRTRYDEDKLHWEQW